MTIKLISREEYDFLIKTFNEVRGLFLQNNGYEYIRKEFTKEEKESRDKVVEILSKSIIGFSEFSNFRNSKRKGSDIEKPQIRIQYNWEADNPSGARSYIGVGYLLIENLLYGFSKTKATTGEDKKEVIIFQHKGWYTIENGSMAVFIGEENQVKEGDHLEDLKHLDVFNLFNEKFDSPKVFEKHVEEYLEHM